MSEEQILNKLREDKDYLRGCTIRKINKGWSSHRKYILSTHDEKYLITIFESKQYENKLRQFDVLKVMISLGVKVPRPIEIGREESLAYMIVSYIEGQDAEGCLNSMDEKSQYDIGIKAGLKLKLMHKLEAPKEMQSWYERKKNKHLRYMEAYAQSQVRLKNEEKIIGFIESNMHLMINRPNLFQHDDYHVGNIIVDQAEIAGIIDFDLMDWGDPVHEFVKIATISRGTSIPFCIGQIHGYLGTNEPDELFWRLYSLYNCMTSISTVVWAQRFHPDRVEEAMAGVAEMLEDHDYFESIKPKWYEDYPNYE